MINSIDSKSQIHFTGKTFPKKGFRECEEFLEKAGKKFKKVTAETYRAYTQSSNIRLDKGVWGYKAPVGSIELKEYAGNMKKSFGLSTEAGGYGGGWLKGSVETPLSTKDVHTCALLNLVNENTGEQMMYHVYSHTGSQSIKELLKKEFPRFTKVNLMPGDQYQTNSTINNVLEAVNELNPKVVKQYYHMPVENPEVVAIGGELRFIENKHPDKMTFTQITNQYNY